MLQADLDALQAERPDVAGFAVTIDHWSHGAVSAATGQADPNGRAMTANTPVRIASITKTFVAVAALRLWEMETLDLDAPIGDLISPAHDAMLTGDGYNTSAITVRHLLMHAGGLNDHFASDVFKDMALAEPEREWTRTEQIALMLETTDPVTAPGERFHYSDTGYLLLGEIIEATTGEPLGQAVRRLTKLDDIGLGGVWWDVFETPAADAPGRAHQWVGDIDTYHIHGSVDVYGGGGVVASVEQTARFFSALFRGDVFDDGETLSLMLEAPGRPAGSPYRIGLFYLERLGEQTYGHGGFWGTDVWVMPAHQITIAGATLNATAIDDLRRLELEVARSALTEQNEFGQND
ncbi:MAG: serine hydrolase domain-containing protein [Pseudomonadota bacterium]